MRLEFASPWGFSLTPTAQSGAISTLVVMPMSFYRFGSPSENEALNCFENAIALFQDVIEKTAKPAATEYRFIEHFKEVLLKTRVGDFI